MWNADAAKNYSEFIETYSLLYDVIKKQHQSIKQSSVVSIEAYKLRPNAIQLGFIENLKKIQNAGEKKALLISATGTGKTYASAFALREINPVKVLFLVHREQIAKQAINSYKKIFGETKTFGLLSGNKKDYKADFLFSTMQMMSREENLVRFRKDEFQVIVNNDERVIIRTKLEEPSKFKGLALFSPCFYTVLSVDKAALTNQTEIIASRIQES